MNRISAGWARFGAGVAAIATTALIGVPSVAYAADALPDLSISFDHEPVAEIDNGDMFLGTYVYNYGQAPATAVTLTFDLSKASDDVVASVPEGNEQCKLADKKVTCAIGQLDESQVLDVYPLVLASRAGAKIGPAGEISATIDGAEDDANPADDTVTFPVTVKASGADLAVYADDLNTAKTPVGPGGKLPLHGLVVNKGDSDATDATVTLNFPTYATVAEYYSDCDYQSYYPDAIQSGTYIYGPTQVVCPLPTLEPDSGLFLFDPVTGESVFNVIFGKNMPGPDENYAYLEAQVGGDAVAAKKAKKVTGKGGSFADALAKLQASASKAKRAAALDETDQDDNYAPFRFWSKKNTLDVRVSTKPISGTVGQTVNLPYEIVNDGPSDGGGPSVLITAPSGTVLLPSEWCWTDGSDVRETLAESKKLRCNFESEFPSVFSGYGKLARQRRHDLR
jgi:hypothetical protein